MTQKEALAECKKRGPAAWTRKFSDTHLTLGWHSGWGGPVSVSGSTWENALAAGDAEAARLKTIADKMKKL